MPSSPRATTDPPASGQGAARGLVTLLFVVLIAAPLAMRDRSVQADPAEADAAAALARYGFALREVSREAGIEFTHAAPALDPKLAPIMPAVASLGAAVSVADFDRDGWPDLYVTTSEVGGRNALYRNLGDGRFEDVAAELGVADVNRAGSGVSMGAVWGDYDNDGWEDLFLYRWGRPTLFHNDGGRGFSPVPDASFPAWINANAAVWFDYDADGRLDLVRIDVRTAEVTPLTDDDALDLAPAWTPDGRHIVFWSDRTGIPNLFAFDVRENRLLQVTNVVTSRTSVSPKLYSVRPPTRNPTAAASPRSRPSNSPPTGAGAAGRAGIGRRLLRCGGGRGVGGVGHGGLREARDATRQAFVRPCGNGATPRYCPPRTCIAPTHPASGTPSVRSARWAISVHAASDLRQRWRTLSSVAASA